MTHSFVGILWQSHCIVKISNVFDSIAARMQIIIQLVIHDVMTA